MRVFSLILWSGQIPTKFHVLRGTWEYQPERLRFFHLQDYHPLWFRFPADSVRRKFCNFPRDLLLPPSISHDSQKATPAGLTLFEFGLFPFRSPLLGEYHSVSLPPGTEMFHFSGFASCLTTRFLGITLEGFPHSGFCGSRAACASPQLIAACHALHRLHQSSHPP